jgi:uncharacterized membrane protein
MSDLIVVGFKDEFKADEVMNELRRLQSEYLVDLEDAAVVVRNQEGKVKIKQAQELVAAGAVSGGYWGLLLGVIFFNPIFALVGAAAGALSGALSDIGINDDFMRDLGSTITSGRLRQRTRNFSDLCAGAEIYTRSSFGRFKQV